MINRKIERAIVTGPTGAVGTALCRTLAERGVRVYAVCRPDSARTDALPKHENISLVKCDLADMALLPSLLPEGGDAFYHLAWAHTIGAGRNDMKAQLDNIRYTLDALAAAKTMGCRVFIGAGSQAEYGRTEGALTPSTPAFPENGYGIAKLCAGQMSRVEAEKLGIDHIWVRILSVYGPGDGPLTMISSVTSQLLDGKKPALTAGDQRWDYLYSFDAADAFSLLAEHGVGGKTYVLGGGMARPLKEYVCCLRDAVDPSLPLGLGEVPYAPLQVMHLEADITELKKDVGFSPKTSFEEGIRATVAAMKKTVSSSK